VNNYIAAAGFSQEREKGKGKREEGKEKRGKGKGRWIDDKINRPARERGAIKSGA
jgi:hypothetical protein